MSSHLERGLPNSLRRKGLSPQQRTIQPRCEQCRHWKTSHRLESPSYLWLDFVLFLESYFHWALSSAAWSRVRSTRASLSSLSTPQPLGFGQQGLALRRCVPRGEPVLCGRLPPNKCGRLHGPHPRPRDTPVPSLRRLLTLPTCFPAVLPQQFLQVFLSAFSPQRCPWGCLIHGVFCL